jgi:predicted PurR-regulated permease PerM
MTWIDSQSGDSSASLMAVARYPLLAFSIVQLLEGWLLTPWSQSKSMEMSPVAVFIVVLTGGSVGGLYGLLLAIPTAGRARILFSDVLLPRLREWAGSSEPEVDS